MNKELTYKDIIDSMNINEDIKTMELLINDCIVNITFHRYLCNIKDFHKYFTRKIKENNYDILDKIYPGVYYKISLINSDIITMVMTGNLILNINETIYLVIIQNNLNRAISDSLFDAYNLFGSRDGLVENVETNISLVQKRLKSSNVVIESFRLGSRGKTDTRIVYLNDIANKNDVMRVKKLLNDINTDAILTSTDLYNLFTKNSLFPLANETGNAGVIANNIYEGKIAIFIDQIPLAIIVPITLTSLVSQKEGKNSTLLITIYNKFLLFIMVFLSIFFLGIYAAFINSHTKNLSIIMISEIKTSLRGNTIPLYFEFILIIFLFDLLRLSTNRSPNISLQTVLSTVGGLLIGQNAVNSGIISSFNLVVAAICYISSYGVTNNQRLIMTISILRYIVLFAGLFMGMYGIIISGILIALYLSKQKSLTVNYFSPLVPYIKHDFFKNIISEKLFIRKKRDKSLESIDQTRGTLW